MKTEDTMYINPTPVILEALPVLQEEGEEVQDEGAVNSAEVQQCTPPSSPLSTLLGTFATPYDGNVLMDRKGKMPLRRVRNAANTALSDTNGLLRISTQNLDASPASSSQDSPQTSGGKRSYYRPHVSNYPHTAAPTVPRAGGNFSHLKEFDPFCPN